MNRRGGGPPERGPPPQSSRPPARAAPRAESPPSSPLRRPEPEAVAATRGLGDAVGVGVGVGVIVGVVVVVVEVTTVAGPLSALDCDEGGRPGRLSSALRGGVACGGGGTRPRIAEGGAELSPMC